MLDDDTLRRARRPGRVDHIRGVVGTGAVGRCAVRLIDILPAGGAHYYSGGTGDATPERGIGGDDGVETSVFDDRPQSFFGKREVEGHVCRATGQYREHRRQQTFVARERQTHTATADDAGARQCAGDAIGGGGEFAYVRVTPFAVTAGASGVRST